MGGADVIDASGLHANGISLTVNGGLGADFLIGGEGSDLLNGDDGDDVMLGGAGDDEFVWNPGDDNDTLEGQGGTDTMLFNGANIAEIIDISANGGRVRFTRDVANITMDLNDVEHVDFHALGGVDTITVNDLSGTDVTNIDVDLAASGGGAGDLAADTVIVNGTNGNDVITVAGTSADASIVGLPSRVDIQQLEPADRIIINALGGDDVIQASGSSVGTTQNGGDGNDVLIGGSAADVLNGEEGDDVLIGEAGWTFSTGVRAATSRSSR